MLLINTFRLVFGLTILLYIIYIIIFFVHCVKNMTNITYLWEQLDNYVSRPRASILALYWEMPTTDVRQASPAFTFFTQMAMIQAVAVLLVLLAMQGCVAQGSQAHSQCYSSHNRFVKRQRHKARGRSALIHPRSTTGHLRGPGARRRDHRVDYLLFKNILNTL